jgi:hypothetical protein
MDDNRGSLCPRVEKYVNNLGVTGFRVRDTNDPAAGVLIDDTNMPGRGSLFLSAMDIHPEIDDQLKQITRHKIAIFVRST